uniref:Uncharacterized protein n=1 Tax=viral metagenome TaxID=1070528 RepID=A0A6M3IGV4_9ZZZZ
MGTPMRKLYKMRCKNCNYTYQYEGVEYQWEHCPLCSHQSSFTDFVEEVRDADLERGNQATHRE